MGSGRAAIATLLTVVTATAAVTAPAPRKKFLREFMLFSL
jgi:hypothetical protein